MSRILVVYASHYGQTRKIADCIAAQLRDHGDEVEVADATGSPPPPGPTGYDAVVLGSRVEVGRHAGELRAYIRAHVDDLARRPTAFFSVSMAAARPDAGPDPDGYLQAMFDDVGWHPTRAVAFAGGLPYRRYGWFVRFMMKRISRSAGNTTDTSRDHEFTNWSAVRALADDVHRMSASEVAVTRV